MNIKSISDLYMETHCVSHARTRLVGDLNVNHALNCTVERESRFTCKKGTAAEAEIQYQKAINMNSVQDEILNFDSEDGRRKKTIFEKDIKDQIKTSLLVDKEERLFRLFSRANFCLWRLLKMWFGNLIYIT